MHSFHYYYISDMSYKKSQFIIIIINYYIYGICALVSLLIIDLWRLRALVSLLILDFWCLCALVSLLIIDLWCLCE